MIVRTPSERSFGLSVGGVAIGAAALAWWRGYPTVALVLSAAGALLVVFGLVAPAALRIPNRVWWRFAQAVGWVNARVLLTLFFVLVLVPVGLAMRLVGRNPLRASRAHTNWSPYPSRTRDPRHYDRLF